jgi:hypothetical protein
MKFSFYPGQKEVIPKQEHLKEGVPAIMACIGTHGQFRENPGAEEVAFREMESDVPGTHNVDYYGSPRMLAEKNFKNPKARSYVISPIDSLDKFSKSFADCTGLVATGYDKKTGENISFLSHQDPAYFLDDETNRNSFISDLEQRLLELKERCSEGTIDAAIVGGNYFKAEEHEDNEEYRKHYLDSIELLSNETAKILGFKPVAMTGPKTVTRGRDDVFYENKNRRFYISRPKVGDGSTQSFTPDTIKDQEEKW